MLDARARVENAVERDLRASARCCTPIFLFVLDLVPLVALFLLVSSSRLIDRGSPDPDPDADFGHSPTPTASTMTTRSTAGTGQASCVLDIARFE